MDIAGLVAGASQGEGLGNQFLSHIRETDAIAHVVRCFENADVVHVAGKIDPIADIEVIDTELALADLQTVEKAVDRATKAAKSGDKEAIRKQALFERVEGASGPGEARALAADDRRGAARPARAAAAHREAGHVRGERDGGRLHEQPACSTRCEKRAAAEGAVVVPVCAAIEAEISQLEEADRAEFLAELGLEGAGPRSRDPRRRTSCLGLQTYFTAGPKEVRAWTVRAGSTAPQAAGVIHTDFERGFIRAEVIAFADYIAGKGEAGAKEAGKLRLEGKEYVVHEGDVMHFRFNV